MQTTRTLIGIFVLLSAIISGLLVFYPMGYLYATYENLYGEWLQFSAFVGIATYAFLIVRNSGLRKSWFWVLLGLAAFYTAMEEISWGQQLFGWESPELFQRKNLQGETNLHNMLTGPYSTFIKDLLTYILTAGIFAYGVVYPVLLHYGFGVAKFAARLGVVAPRLCLMPFFVVAAICEMSFFRFNEAELAELFVALALFFQAIITHRQLQHSDDRRLARYCGMSFLIICLCAVVLTQISLHSSTSERRVANRIEAGVKKFAGRYARIDAWDHAVNLYQRHLAYEPDSRSRIRRLAGAYESAGRMEERRRTLEQALQMDLELVKKESWRASVHRSLYRTYKELGDMPNATRHVNEALRINQQRLQEHPDSAAAEYSMARTLDLLGRRIDAIQHYKRAFDLKPGSSTYRRAYRDAIN